MIDFFAFMFLGGLLGFIIFGITAAASGSEGFAIMFFICFIIIAVSGFGMEWEKSKEPKTCECQCECCIIEEGVQE